MDYEIIRVHICNGRILVNTVYASFIYDFSLNFLGGFGFGNPDISMLYKDLAFSADFIIFNENRFINNIMANLKTGEIIKLPIETDIPFYVFHEQYFIPVTYPYAFKDHVYGPEVTLYNYKAEVIWTKDFRIESTYVNSLPQFRENERVSVTNIKVWEDKLLISTSTQHLLCYDIHTGHQIWAIDNFGSTHVHLVAFDPEEGTGFVVCSGEEGVFWSLYKIDLFEGKILAEKPIREWESSGFSNILTSWTLTEEGLWTATQFTGKIGRINRETLEIDLVYEIEEVRGIAQHCAPHVTKEFVMIEDGWRNLEIIKR